MPFSAALMLVLSFGAGREPPAAAGIEPSTIEIVLGEEERSLVREVTKHPEEGFGRDPRVVFALHAVARQIGSRVRAHAYSLMIEAGTVPAREHLRRVTESEHPQDTPGNRQHLARLLLGDDYSRLERRCLIGLTSESEIVVTSSARVLGEALSSLESRDRLGELFGTGVRKIQEQIAASLLFLGDRRGVDALAPIIDSAIEGDRAATTFLETVLHALALTDRERLVSVAGRTLESSTNAKAIALVMAVVNEQLLDAEALGLETALGRIPIETVPPRADSGLGNWWPAAFSKICQSIRRSPRQWAGHPRIWEILRSASKAQNDRIRFQAVLTNSAVPRPEGVDVLAEFFGAEAPRVNAAGLLRTAAATWDRSMARELSLHLDAFLAKDHGALVEVGALEIICRALGSDVGARELDLDDIRRRKAARLAELNASATPGEE